LKNARYKIVRPFLFLLNGNAGEQAQAFIDFVLSKEGQIILKKEGLIDIL